MAFYGYNYPWSGRLGSIADCCIYCGDFGPSFHLSSRGARCGNCRGTLEPIPELYEKFEKEYVRFSQVALFFIFSA